VKNGDTGKWLDEYMQRNQFEQSWVLMTEGEALHHFSPFSSPEEPHWQEIEGIMAKDLNLQPTTPYIAVFTRPAAQQF
jgi:hypothetical protein